MSRNLPQAIKTVTGKNKTDNSGAKGNSIFGGGGSYGGGGGRN